jgi:hypothetical protein
LACRAFIRNDHSDTEESGSGRRTVRANACQKSRQLVCVVGNIRPLPESKDRLLFGAVFVYDKKKMNIFPFLFKNKGRYFKKEGKR